MHASGLISYRVNVRYGIQAVVTSPSAVPAAHSAQSASTAAVCPIRLGPRISVPVPTVISAIAGAPQNCAATGLPASARTRSGYRIKRTAQAVVRASRAAAASAHTTVANVRSPGTRKGRSAPAMATMPVPMIDAYQFGPRSRTKSPGRSSSLSKPNGGWCEVSSAAPRPRAATSISSVPIPLFVPVCCICSSPHASRIASRGDAVMAASGHAHLRLPVPRSGRGGSVIVGRLCTAGS